MRLMSASATFPAGFFSDQLSHPTFIVVIGPCRDPSNFLTGYNHKSRISLTEQATVRPNPVRDCVQNAGTEKPHA